VGSQNWTRWSGIFGIAFAVLELIVAGLYISLGTLPPLTDTTKFSDFVAKNPV